MLEIDGLRVATGGHEVLRGLDLVVGPGEAVAVLGPNGAGKTTLLRAVAGLARASAGTIVYGGQRLDQMGPAEIVRSGVCLVPEQRRIFAGLTVVDNLRAGAVARPRSWRWRSRRGEESDVGWVMDVFPGLRPVAYRTAGTLRAGEQQVLALARAMVTRPRLLLVDELSAGIAPALRLQLFDVLRTLGATGMAILAVEQHVNLGLELAKRVYVIENGRITVATESDRLCLSDVSWQSTQPGGGVATLANRSKGGPQ
ncbi:MAG: ABC transporter ATP-binding protein [Acidimicrobiia bacterium]